MGVVRRTGSVSAWPLVRSTRLSSQQQGHPVHPPWRSPCLETAGKPAEQQDCRRETLAALRRRKSQPAFDCRGLQWRGCVCWKQVRRQKGNSATEATCSPRPHHGGRQSRARRLSAGKQGCHRESARPQTKASGSRPLPAAHQKGKRSPCPHGRSQGLRVGIGSTGCHQRLACEAFRSGLMLRPCGQRATEAGLRMPCLRRAVEHPSSWPTRCASL